MSKECSLTKSMKQEFFTSVTLHRDDLRGHVTKKKREALTDEQMERLAMKLHDMLTYDWDIYMDELAKII